MSKAYEISVQPYGPLETVAGDDAITALWTILFSLPEGNFTGEWVLEKGFLVPKRLGKKDIGAYQKVIAANYTDPAERAALLTEFSRIQTQSWSRKVETTEYRKQDPLDAALAQVLGKYVRWTPRSGGSYGFVVRASQNTWSPCADPWTELTYFYPHGKTLDGVAQANGLEHLAMEVETLQQSGATKWGVTSVTDPMSGNSTYSFLPFLAEARKRVGDQRLTDHIASDIRLIIHEPITFSNDINIPCLAYFPLAELEKHRGGDCRHWINFESQMPEGFRATWRAQFFGVFCDKNRSRQITLLYDRGQTGKSSMFRAIIKVAGERFVSTQSKDSSANQFWASAVYGSRLVLFPDTGNTKVSMMTKIKNLTGGDPIPVEFKGQTPFPWVPNVRVWASSNQLPEIDVLAKHQRSRLLVFPLTGSEDPEILKEFCEHHTEPDGNVVIHRDRYGDPINIGFNFDEALAGEFWAYLALCEKSYLDLCQNNQDIPVPPCMEEFISGGCLPDSTLAIGALLKNLIEITLSPAQSLTNKELRALIKYVAEEGRDTLLKMKDLKNYLKSYGCKDFHDGASRGLRGVALRRGVSITGDTLRAAGASASVPAAHKATIGALSV
jgi:hypothetical protein